MLKEDNTFQLISRYVVASSKITAFLAIYNDMTFISSIGELTTPHNANESQYTSTKPGMSVTVNDKGRVTGYGATDGWEYGPDREPSAWSWTVKEWDDWDKILLRQSKARIKRLFKGFYHTRKFNPTPTENFDFAGIWLKNLKSALFPPVGANLLPSWQKGRLRTNPFDSNGKLCKK